MSSFNKLRLSIEGINSRENLQKLRQSLQAVAGIENVEGSGGNLVTVHFDGSKTNADDIQNAVQTNGYHVTQQGNFRQGNP